MLPGHGTGGGKKGNLCPGKVEAAEFFDAVMPALEFLAAARRARARQQVKLAYREPALLEDGEQGFADNPGRTDDGQAICNRPGRPTGLPRRVAKA